MDFDETTNNNIGNLLNNNEFCSEESLPTESPGAESDKQDELSYVENINTGENIYNESSEHLKHDTQNTEQKTKKKKRKIIALIISASAFFVIVGLLTANIFIPLSKYEKALKNIDSGNYSFAKHLLFELGDYKDSLEKINEINYLILREYITKNGTSYNGQYRVTRELSDATISIVTTSTSAIEIIYDFSNTVGKTNFKLTLVQESNNASFSITRDIMLTIVGKTGVNKESATGSIDISAFSKNSSVNFENYTNTGTFSSTMNEDSLKKVTTEYLTESLNFLEDILKNPEIGITLSDLGFYAYGSYKT